MSIQLDKIVHAIEQYTDKPLKNNRLCCPAHGDNNYNLLIKDEATRVSIICFTQHCDPLDVLEAVGLKLSDVYYDLFTGRQKEKKEIISKYNVQSEILEDMVSLSMIVQKRAHTRIYENNELFRKNNPEWAPYPEEYLDAEIKAARRLYNNLPLYYEERKQMDDVTEARAAFNKNTN
jgi:hypothetical protein